jgi:hypothetical protein
LGINKARLAQETIQHAADNAYVFTVTLETVQEEFRQNYATYMHTPTPGKSQPVLLLTTPSPKKSFPKTFKKDCSLCG